MTDTPYDRLRDRLADVTGYTGREFQGRLSTRCPAHQDRGPSLSVRDAGDRVLVKCFAGCDTDEVLAALGLSMRDLFNGPERSPRQLARRSIRSERHPLNIAYTTEPPDVPDEVKRDMYAASTAHVPVGDHPGGPVAPW